MKRLVRIGLQSTAGWSGKDIEPLRGKDIQMVIVSMTRCGDGGAEIISSWPRLQSLMAEDCGLTDKGLKAISKLEHLDFLNVHQNKALTKKAIMSLASMRALRKLYVDEACLDQTGILAMQRKNPNLEIKLTKLTNFGD